MCFKKLRSLKNLDKFEPEDFEIQVPYNHIYVKPPEESYDVDIEIVPKEPVTYVDDWSYDEETTAGTGTIIFSKIPKIAPKRKPFRLDEHQCSIKWKAKCDECGEFFNLPHEMYLLPQKKGDPKYVCIYCYQEEESN